MFVSGNDMMAGTKPGFSVPETCHFPSTGRHDGCHGTIIDRQSRQTARVLHPRAAGAISSTQSAWRPRESRSTRERWNEVDQPAEVP